MNPQESSRMTALHDIDLKIEELKKKKEALRLKAAEALFKKLEKISASDFDPSLILGLVSASLNKATDQQKEEWRQLGKSFLRSRAEKTQEIS